jgi:hypothetical protein
MLKISLNRDELPHLGHFIIGGDKKRGKLSGRFEVVINDIILPIEFNVLCANSYLAENLLV